MDEKKSVEIATKKPSPKWLSDGYDRKKRSDKHERRIAKKVGGRRLANSGGRPWSKTYKTTAGGDVSTLEFLLEHKRTDNASMVLHRSWLEKVADGARRQGKTPCVAVTFEQRLREPYDWVLVPLEVAKRIFGGLDGS